MNKVRLLQFKGWLDLALYTSRRAPEPLLDEIVHYQPKHPEGSWDEIFKRVVEHEDDGHASKLVRALKHGQQICKPYNDDPRFRVKDNMWLNLAHMGESEYHSKPSACCNCANEFPKRSTRLKIRVIRG